MSSARDDEIEEERRLLYVAMTRARDHLTIMLPQRFYVQQQAGSGDRHVYASRSRFLTADACAAFDHETWPIGLAASTDNAATAGTPIDLAARIRAAWAAPAK
jgi:DNA helicase-2/ATP-dependent DNA helicase PcrA